MKKIWLILSLLLATNLVVAAPIIIEPRDCILYNALTAGSDRTSSAIDVSKMGHLSVQLKWASLTGSIDGTFKIQVSTVPNPGSGDWVDKAGATFTLSGATSTNLINITIIGERWARGVFTHTSISGGTITGYCHAKSF